MNVHDEPAQAGEALPGHLSVPLPLRPAAEVREWFLDFYADQYPQVVRFVMFSRHASPSAAEDAAQNAFTVAWQRIQQGRWATVLHPHMWIRVIALRQYDHPHGMRRTQPQTQSATDDELALLLPVTPAPAELSAITLDLLEALRALRDEQARTVMAFTLDGFTDSEIGLQLGITSQQVRNKRTKARRFLARRLAPHRAQEGDIR